MSSSTWCVVYAAVWRALTALCGHSSYNWCNRAAWAAPCSTPTCVALWLICWRWTRCSPTLASSPMVHQCPLSCSFCCCALDTWCCCCCCHVVGRQTSFSLASLRAHPGGSSTICSLSPGATFRDTPVQRCCCSDCAAAAQHLSLGGYSYIDSDGAGAEAAIKARVNVQSQVWYTCMHARS